MSILRKPNVALSNLRNAHVALSNWVPVKVGQTLKNHCIFCIKVKEKFLKNLTDIL